MLTVTRPPSVMLAQASICWFGRETLMAITHADSGMHRNDAQSIVVPHPPTARHAGAGQHLPVRKDYETRMPSHKQIPAFAGMTHTKDDTLKQKNHMHKEPTTYIMMNKTLTTIYTGVTSNIEQRVLQHKAGVGSEFTSKYKCTMLVYFEQFQKMTDAIDREKQLKNWKREWKLNLIKSVNPDFIDLAKDWFDDETIEAYRKNFGK